MNSPIDRFRTAMLAAGLTPPDDIHGDGKLYRFSTNGKPKDESGWYVLHLDGLPAGAFGCWREDLWQTWCSKTNDTMTEAEREAQRQRLEAMRLQRETDTAQRQDAAATVAAQRWQAATPAAEHPYLTTKGVKPYGARCEGAALLIPMRDVAGKLCSLQTINADGGKRFQSGGKVTGCFHAIGEPKDVLIVCEGYATGASIHEATGHAVAVAFNAGNLLAVAKALNQNYPTLRLILAADDDWKTEGNPGKTKASEAAQAVGGLMAVPTFPDDRPDRATDFNDLHKLAGLAAVKAGIDSAVSKTEALQPLVNTLEPQPYPVDVLPQVLREAVQEVQDYVQAPMAMVATSALSAVSLACQGFVDVRRDPGLQGPASLYTLVLAESGERKTTCDTHFTTVLRQWEKDERERMAPEVKKYQSAHAAWFAKKEGLLSKIRELAKTKGSGGEPDRNADAELQALIMGEPKAPRVAHLFYTEPSIEKLGLGLATVWPSAGLFVNEAATFFGGHAMKGDNLMAALGFYNMAWDGQTLRAERKSVESFETDGARLTISLMVQESVLQDFASKGGGKVRGSGFWARYLVAAPPSNQGHRLYKKAPLHWPARTRFDAAMSRVLAHPLNIDEHGALKPQVLSLSHEAFEVWRDFYNGAEEQLRMGGDYQDVRDVASKIADQAARLAALLHWFEIGPDGGMQIGPEIMGSACALAAWHLEEARRFFGELALPTDVGDAMTIERWLLNWMKRKPDEAPSMRTLQTHGPNHLRKGKRLDDAMAVLFQSNHFREVKEGRRTRLAPHPDLIKGAQA